MAIKLDDFLSKKKEAAPVLDFRNATANSKEQLKALLDKVPEFRIRPEKIKPEEIKIREKDFNFRTPKRELKHHNPYQFADPVPPEMRDVRLEDLSSVNIPWKMLTTLRPKNKVEDEFFSRLVELGKLRMQTEQREKRISNADFIRKMKSRSGVIETRLVSCTDCCEEFCMGETCSEFSYEAFMREDPALQAAAVGSNKPGGVDEKKTRRRRSRKRQVKNIPGIPKDRSKIKERKKSKSREGRKSASRERRGKSKSKERRKGKSRSREKKDQEGTGGKGKGDLSGDETMGKKEGMLKTKKKKKKKRKQKPKDTSDNEDD